MAAGSSECHRQQLQHGARCTTRKFERHETTQNRHILRCDSAGPLPAHCRQHAHTWGHQCRRQTADQHGVRAGTRTRCLICRLSFSVTHVTEIRAAFFARPPTSCSIVSRPALRCHGVPLQCFISWIRRFVHVRTAHMMEVLAALASARLPTSCSMASRPALRCHAAPIARPAEVSAACRASSARTSLTVRYASWSEECT